MKILLIANYLPDNQPSMQLFAGMLYRGLCDLGHDVRVIRPEPFFCRFKKSFGGPGKWPGYLDKMVLFPLRLSGKIARADIVHICDHSNAIYVKYLKNVPHLVTCCDLLAVRSALNEFKENPTKWTGRQLQKMILNGLNRSRRVACISEATEKDLLRISSLKKEKVSVVYMGLNYPYSPMESQKARNILNGTLNINYGDPFLLHVGKNNWYKNRMGALRIFACMNRLHPRSRLRLVFAGEGLSKEMRMFAGKQSIENMISEVILPKSEQLRALYSSAKALLYPSLAEGFGWPIVEAQACGCPVFTTNRSPMTEAGGSAAVYIDPSIPEAAASVILQSLGDKRKADKMREDGLRNIKRFSSEEMAKNYVRIYKEILR